MGLLYYRKRTGHILKEKGSIIGKGVSGVSQEKGQWCIIGKESVVYHRKRGSGVS